MAELDDFINQAGSLDPSDVKKAPKLDKREELPADSKKLRGAANKAMTKALQVKGRNPLERASKTPHKAIEQAFRNFERAAGSRNELLRTLHYVPEANTAFKLIIKLLQDPTFVDDPETASLYSACYKHGIPLTAMVLAFKDAKVAEMSLQALTKLALDAPQVLDQIGDDAQNRFDACPVCEGKCRVQRMNDQGEWALDEDGHIKTQLCYNCRGTGKVFKLHDSQSRKQFLQITGILDEKKSNININTGTQQVAVLKADFLPGDGSFEKLIKAIDTVTGTRRFGDDAPIEAEIIDIAVYEEKADNPPA